ncbi:hypothetical protein FRY74_09410 [Vicingus serpentipes]|uniref:Uncharacterized protein n=1 Tax=Vicingus serpentipes TaxID=1926625 RepID=A0A5C6RQV9_9FLAO|nr:hypothetical protein [Vicingus serpentipes]TXB64658.1 hypothetical protein FRY74_09410 [Vicingus serpentipes]
MKYIFLTTLIFSFYSLFAQSDSINDVNSELNFYTKDLSDKLIMPYLTLVDMDGGDFFDHGVGNRIQMELANYNGILVNEKSLIIEENKEDDNYKSMKFYTGGPNKQKYLSKYVINNLNAKSTLAELLGRNEDGGFDIDKLNAFSDKIIHKKGINKNEDFAYDRTVDEVGVALMLNTYFLVKIDGKLFIFRINIERKNLTSYAQEYWFENSENKNNLNAKYDSLKIPVEYIDMVPLNFISNNNVQKNGPRYAQKVVNTLINNNIWFKDLSKEEGEKIISINDDKTEISLDELLKGAYRTLTQRKTPSRTSYYYLTDIVENKQGKLENKIVGKLLVRPQTKEARQIGGRKIHKEMKIIQTSNYFNLSIGYNPFIDVTSNGINYEIGIPIRRSRKGFTNLEFIFAYTKSFTKRIDAGNLVFDYNYYPEINTGSKYRAGTGVRKNINGVRSYKFWSFTLFGISAKAYLSNRGNFFIKYNISFGMFGNNVTTNMFKTETGSGTVGGFFKNSIGLHHYLNHRVNFFIRPTLTSRSHINQYINVSESEISRKAGGWNDEFRNIGNSKLTGSILFGFNFDI